MYTSMQIPELNSTRRVWVYLPEDYAISNLSYPVLYMQDGQNLFDAAASFSGEWGIDEFLDSVKAQLIVVAIDNGGERRINEYNPNDSEEYGEGLGHVYLQRISTHLKPYIDKHFRTKPDSAHTYVAGSSMGGLITFYAGMYYPEVFGTIGVFSPSFWLVPNLNKQIGQHFTVKHSHQRFYFYGGEQESDSLVKQLKDASKLVKKYANAQVTMHIEKKGKHSELAWKKMFPAFY